MSNTYKVTIVTGPPASGKSSYVQENKQDGDLIIDWERLANAITGSDARQQGETAIELIGEMRRAAISKIEKIIDQADSNVWLIIGAPTSKERLELKQKLNAKLVLILCDKNLSIDRIKQDKERSLASEEQIKAVERWWSKYTIGEVDDIVYTDNIANSKAVSVPDYVIENAKKGLIYYEEGYAGDGLVSETISEARDMANGIVSDDKVKRIAPWIARHIIDLEAPKNNDRNDPEYPGAGLVAMLLWGGGPDREGAIRTQNWAEEEIAKIDSTKNISTTNEVKEQKLMQTKTFKADIEVKATDPNADAPYGSFTALVSVFNNTDLVGDRIIPGAFADSLKSYEASGKVLPIVWSHDWSNADSFIGKTLSAIETADGLLVNGAFFNTPKAQHIRELLTQKVVSEFSFAYDVIDQQTAKDGVNELLKLNILEAGPTLKGANPDTQLVSAKTLLKNDKAEPGELMEGSFVTFVDGYGRVEYIMTEGSFGVENDPLSLEATPENPLAMVRIYQEIDETYIATDLFRGFRFSELETSEEKSLEKKLLIDNAKAGRTLSTKNEIRIKDAVDLLNGVLTSLDTINNSDQAKSEESEKTKVEEHELDANVALNLLTIEDLENN